jgi:hypothetical protein
MTALPDVAHDWMLEARCASVDPELFYPEPGGSPRNAIAICADCPVRKPCLQRALEHEAQPGETPYGIWGGLTAVQRAGILGRTTVRTKPCPECGTPSTFTITGTPLPCGLCRHYTREAARRTA